MSSPYDQMDVEQLSPYRTFASPVSFASPYSFVQESPHQEAATIAQVADHYVAPIKRPLKQFTRKRKSAAAPTAAAAVATGATPPKKQWHRPEPAEDPDEARFCKACGITTTPQWRRGPDGERSLCNACGLHYYKCLQREKTVERKREVGTPLPIHMLLNDPDY